MQRFTFPLACACLVALTASTGIVAQSPLVMSLVDLPDVNTHTQFVTPTRDERTIDLDVDKQLAADQEAKFKSPIKRKHADQRTKHPFIITKDDLDNLESVVEDNIIVESGVLHLNRQNKRVNNELLRARRVRRGWNLQNVIVPDEPLYQRVPQASRRWVSRPVGRSKLYWADQAPSKNNQLYNYRSWGNEVQDLRAWPAKIHG